MNTVILAKSLFRKAEEIYTPSDIFTHGLTVSLLQDSAEMLVWAIAKHVDANVKPKDSFVAIIETLDKSHGGIKLKPQIFELNSARVNFKHYGNIPSNIDIPKYIDNCRKFLQLNTMMLGVDFDTVSSADDVSIPEIREHLKRSEDFLRNDSIEDALLESSIAFQVLEKHAYSKLNIDSFSINEIKNSYEAWPKDQWEKARDFTDKLFEILEHNFKYISRSQFGYSAEYFSSVKDMCYQVNLSMTGKVLGVYNLGHASEDENSVKFINDFIIEASRRL